MEMVDKKGGNCPPVFWGWPMCEFGGGKCLIYWGGKYLPGKCLTKSGHFGCKYFLL